MSVDDYPLYSVIDLSLGDRDAALTIMHSGIRYHIRVTMEDLRGSQRGIESSSLELQFLQFRQALDDEPSAMEALEEWMVEPCLL